MNCIQSLYKAQIEVKKSKFISFLVPLSDFKNLLEHLKKEHFKANHIVWAKRELNEFNQIVENSSDDGEPKNAAGVPTLNQLRGANLINCAIITVRYFGGIKLGVGGMVRAYSKAAKEVIDCANLVEYKKLIDFEICKPYNKQRELEYNLKKLQITDINREFKEDKICYRLKVPQELIDKLKML
jgi:uncharacterized YigZ family protein